MRKIVWVLMLLLLIDTGVEASPLNHISEALELAKQEQILVSRMLKDYVLIGSHYRRKEQSAAELNASALAYAAGLKKLQKMHMTPEWKRIIDPLIQQWADVRHYKDQAPNKEMIMTYAMVFEKMRLLWRKPITMLMREMGIPVNDPRGVASDFRSYAEQLPTLYLLKSWGMKNPKKINDSMQEIGKKINQGFRIFTDSPQTTPEMMEIIKRLKKLALYFQVMWNTEIKTPTIIMKKSREAYDLSEKLMKKYEK